MKNIPSINLSLYLSISLYLYSIGYFLIDSKICNYCKEEKTLDCFTKDGSGYRARCKTCLKEIRHGYKTDAQKIKNIPDFKTCRICKIEKAIKNFKRESGNADLHNNACKDCKALSDFKKKHTSIDSFCKRLLTTAKDSAKVRERKNDESAICTLTWEDIMNMCDKQEMRCFYSGIKMNIDKKKWQMSLERLDQSKGYIPENTVLCCLEFNGAIQWSHKKIEDMMKMLSEQEENTKRGKADSSELYKFDLETHQKYRIPGIDRVYSPRFHLQKLLTNASAKSKIRNINKPRIGDYELDFDFIVDLYYKQDGKCAYSKIPLQLRTGQDTSYNRKASLERKDPFLGYTRDNVCLICYEFNTMDNAVKYKTKDEADSAGWSEEKFQEFIASYKEYKEYKKDEENKENKENKENAKIDENEGKEKV